MSATNPYRPPGANVADFSDANAGTQEIKLWSGKGRLGRVRYFVYPIIASFCIVPVMIVIGILSGFLHAPALVTLGTALVEVPLLIFSVLLGIQRAHDMDWSGWSVLWLLIPFAVLFWWFKPGTQGANRFGAPPPPNSRSVTVLVWLVLAFTVLAIGIGATVGVKAYEEFRDRANHHMPIAGDTVPMQQNK